MYTIDPLQFVLFVLLIVAAIVYLWTHGSRDDWHSDDDHGNDGDDDSGDDHDEDDLDDTQGGAVLATGPTFRPRPGPRYGSEATVGLRASEPVAIL